MSTGKNLAIYGTIAAASFGVGFAKAKARESGLGLDLLLIGTPVASGIAAAMTGPTPGQYSKGDVSGLGVLGDGLNAALYGAGGVAVSFAAEAVGTICGYVFK